MVGTDPVDIIQLGPGDAPAGLVLSTEAHWNQNEADWRFFLTRGTVFGVRDHDRHLVATAALLPYTLGSRPDWSTPASTPRPGSASPAGSTRRLMAPGSMARWALRRRCSCGGCVWRTHRRRRPNRPSH